MDVDLPDVVAEVEARVRALRDRRWCRTTSPRSTRCSTPIRARMRYGIGENLTAIEEITRVSRRALAGGAGAPIDADRHHHLRPRFAVASTLFHRDSAPGKVGRQMQTWVRFPEGWRVVAAHVSVIDQPRDAGMSLDDLQASAALAAAEPVVPRVDRARAHPDKITRAEELRLQLADEIVRGALPPGTALDETDIARRFNVSRTPVREALRQLAASGLVDARAHRGAVVARPRSTA